MDENNEKLNGPPSEGSQYAMEGEPKLREISKEELKQILEDHQKWMKSDGKEGEKANFYRTNLAGVDLHDSILQGANFIYANLEGANFINANLKEAHLSRTNLKNAILRATNLERALLSYANLQEASLQDAGLQEADLHNADLKKANLSSANLQRTNFIDANLEGTILSNTNLNKANLFKANLNSAELAGVKGLSRANIKYANFEGTTGLLGIEFSRNDLTGTKLPEKIDEFKTLDVVEETSKNARKMFFAMLLGCVYSWLTIATTTDTGLLTNTSSSPLPIIGTDISIAYFYWSAPFVLLGLFFYFHLYLHRLWEGLATLPARFPDGKRLDQLVYPWLLNGIVRRHFELLKSERITVAKLEELVTIFLAWWTVPFTLCGFWLRYLTRQEWFGTWLHILLLMASIASSVIFYRLSAITLKDQKSLPFRWPDFWSGKKIYQSATVILGGILLWLLSYGAINGLRPETININRSEANVVQRWVPKIFGFFGYIPFANFQELEVSSKPSDYYKMKLEERSISVKGANLRHRNLRSANMYRSFLANADLRDANLQGANLSEANLVGANLKGAKLIRADLQKAKLVIKRGKDKATYLRGADLSETDMTAANLRGADLPQNLQGIVLRKANLQHTILIYADLADSDLQETNLQGSNLHGAYLQNANLHKANLKGVDLSFTNLKGADLSEANIEGANLSYANIDSVNFRGAKGLTLLLPNNHHDRLQQKNLSGLNLEMAELRGADLRGANLQGTNLKKANLSRADLRGADLRGADMRQVNLEYTKLQGADLRNSKLSIRSFVSGDTKFELANVYGVVGLKQTMLDTMLKYGAVQIESDEEWHKMLKSID